jgi:hypothetical protein
VAPDPEPPAIPAVSGDLPLPPVRWPSDTRIAERVETEPRQSRETPVAVEFEARLAPAALAVPVAARSTAPAALATHVGSARRPERLPERRVVEHATAPAVPAATVIESLGPPPRRGVPAASSAAPPPLPEARPADAHAAPTIKVHIGRIEVRAVMSPPAPAPRPERAKPMPALGLKGYLEQRRRGRT